MNWPGFYSLSSGWLFALLIPLLILYFLKLKRPRHEISSLALWRQVIDDQRVNSPFQKFKRNFLLLLQTLLLSLLALAAMQPFWPGDSERAEYRPVLIDCSASMAAVGADGQSRLDAAKDAVRDLIDGMLPDQRLSLLSVTSTARRLTEFTDNKRLLHEALDKLEVSDVPTEIDDALRMAQALSRTEPFDSVLIYSDGNFPDRVDFELPFDLNFQQLPAAGANVGITDFNGRRSGADEWDVFVRVSGSDHDTAASVNLLQDGELIAEQSVILDKGDSQRLVFDVLADNNTSLEVRLVPDGPDTLATDNTAWLDLPETRPLEVYCSPELLAFRHALTVLEGINVDTTDQPTQSRYDIAFVDKEFPADVECPLKLVIGVVPPDVEKLLNVKDAPAQVVDWDRSELLLQHVNMAAVEVVDQPELPDEVGDANFEQAGYRVITHSSTGPLVLKRRDEGNLSYYFVFHTDRSTLPYNVGFPVLVANAVQIALRQASLSEIRGQETGVLPVRRLLAEQEYMVEGPDKMRRDYTSNSDGTLTGVAASKAGRYRISSDGTPVDSVGVSVLDQRETSLAAVEEIQFRELSVAAAEQTVDTDRPLWPMLAILAFLVLLVEWWYFQRRPGGAPT